MLDKFEKKDILYLGVIVVFIFLLLAQVKDIPLSSYGSLADAKLKGIAPGIDIVYLPVFLGIIISIALYAVLRIKFQSLPVFFALLLTVTSGAFINNFILGSFSLPVSILFGEINLAPSFSIQKLSETVLLLPFALFTLGYLLYKRRYEKKNGQIVFAFSLIGIISAIVFPLFAIPFLAFCASYVMNNFKENKEENILLGLFIVVGIVLSLIPHITATGIGLAILSGILLMLLLYLTEMRYKINMLLVIVLLFLSIAGSAVNIFSIQRIDIETINALSQLSQVQGNVAVASIYDEIGPAAYYLSGKTVNANEGLVYAFSEGGLRNFDYLLVDTLILDNPKNYSAKVNQTAKFEAFGFVKKTVVSTESGNYSAALFYSASNVMIMPIDESGNPISDKVEIGGDWVSRFSLFELNATGGYYRFINPKGDTGKNILKILFPEQLFYNESQLVWQSNTSRMRLYKFG